MTQTKYQREWYIRNIERILISQSIKTHKKQEKRKRTLVCPACKKEFVTSNSGVKYCGSIRCKKMANYYRGIKFRNANKEYLKEYYKEYDVINKALRKETSRKRHPKKEYGLTVDDYDAMLKKQHGKCAICGKSSVKLHVDHDHKTTKVRSLLCFHCNAGLGHFEENLDTLMQAIGHLKAHIK